MQIGLLECMRLGQFICSVPKNILRRRFSVAFSRPFVPFRSEPVSVSKPGETCHNKPGRRDNYIVVIFSLIHVNILVGQIVMMANLLPDPFETS